MHTYVHAHRREKARTIRILSKRSDAGERQIKSDAEMTRKIEIERARACSLLARRFTNARGINSRFITVCTGRAIRRAECNTRSCTYVDVISRDDEEESAWEVEPSGRY